MVSLDDEKLSLILVSNDKKEFKYNYNKFMRISKLFKDQVTCDTFHEFGNIKDKIINYSLPFSNKLIDWILNEYYVDEHFDTFSDYIIYKKYKLDIINTKFLVDIYMFSFYMNCIQLKFEIEQYLLTDYVEY